MVLVLEVLVVEVRVATKTMFGYEDRWRLEGR